MKKKSAFILGIFLLLIMCNLQSIGKSNTVNKLEQDQEKIEKELSVLKDDSGNIAKQLNDLNGNLAVNTMELSELELEEKNLKDSIDKNTKEIAELQEQYELQYQNMKKRIQFVYEKGQATFLSMLSDVDSMADLVSQSEYVVEMNRYDRAMLKKYQDTKLNIYEKNQVLEREQEEILVSKKRVQEKQDVVQTLIEKTKMVFEENQKEQEDKETLIKEYEKKIEAQIAYEEELEAQKALEDAKRLEEIKKQEEEDFSNNQVNVQAGDIDLLAAIIYCEARGESYEGQLAVASVVMNRVQSSYFPNTVAGVIYQEGQFTPVQSGSFAVALAMGVQGQCRQAAQEVLDGNRTLKSLYFRRNNGQISGTVIGNHVFY